MLACCRAYYGSVIELSLTLNKGKNHKTVQLPDVDMLAEASLIGSHAFTGNDYISAFLKKEKVFVGKYC